VRPAGVPGPQSNEGVRPLTEADLPDVMRSDDRLSGARRHGALRWAFGDAPSYAWIDASSPPDSPGYCLGRGGRLFDHIGPIVADRTDPATRLVAATLGQAGDRSLVVDAYDTHDGFTAWLTAAGFEPQRPLYRMRRRGSLPTPRPRQGLPLEFGVMGPEFS